MSYHSIALLQPSKCIPPHTPQSFQWPTRLSPAWTSFMNSVASGLWSLFHCLLGLTGPSKCHIHFSSSHLSLAFALPAMSILHRYDAQFAPPSGHCSNTSECSYQDHSIWSCISFLHFWSLFVLLHSSCHLPKWDHITLPSWYYR